MKRMFVFAALAALAAAGCAAPAPSPNGNAAPPTANAAATPAASPAEMSDADHVARERQVYDAFKAKNHDAFAAFLADDFLYVTNDGVHDKAVTMQRVKDTELTDLTLSDFKVLKVDKDAVVITYKTTAKGKYKGKDFPPGDQRESSAWVKRGDKWLVVYHQDTAVLDAPAGQGAASATTPTPHSAASPSASPAGTASPPPADPVSTEKAIWEALGRKDYDAFAGFLADEAIDVEPNGVFDKKQSVEMVRQADFAGAALSDFKEVKFDEDAALVTYLVKSTKKGFHPQGERHSTVLAKRGDRWRPVFHQGTYVTK